MGGITALAFSLDGHLVVSGGADGVILVWDDASRSQIRAYSGHAGPISNVVVLLKPPLVRAQVFAYPPLPPSSTALGPDSASRLLPLAPLRRVPEALNPELAALGRTAVMALPIPWHNVSSWSETDPSSPSAASSSATSSSLLPPPPSSSSTTASSAREVPVDMEREISHAHSIIANLRAEIDRLKTVNKRLFQAAASNVLEEE